MHSPNSLAAELTNKRCNLSKASKISGVGCNLDPDQKGSKGNELQTEFVFTNNKRRNIVPPFSVVESGENAVSRRCTPLLKNSSNSVRARRTHASLLRNAPL